MEGTSRNMRRSNSGVADLAVTNALVGAAEKKGYVFHTGVVQCKDAFYGQHEPEVKPVVMNCSINGSMEAAGMSGFRDGSAALFIVASSLGVRRFLFLVVANQEREKLDWKIP